MRIIGGEFRGRTFFPGKTFKARPTTDIAKESLFNILTNRIDFEETSVLDLFAGTGSISFEFLSRGCKNVTLVEINFKHIQFIKSVLSQLKTKAIVYRTDVFRYVKTEKRKFDIIFADPPYDHPQFNEIPKLILEQDILTNEGILIVEHPANFNFETLKGYTETRKYGKVHFSFFGH
ncbi:MAG: 16S rRNA (guanine(966)-N(2))-methyltransferase RsmD [Prolixibacteraceae bacterium]|nr:16S rRNA (guanine(966)-N(2))-methyltransferase RsmD [Prolixibacteraceae bacterium]MBN2649178.1 16S rRNA (guanine(966)-N(2))-methyltransferase RsmD [Prolixibacteraceae bacterium]